MIDIHNKQKAQEPFTHKKEKKRTNYKRINGLNITATKQWSNALTKQKKR